MQVVLDSMVKIWVKTGQLPASLESFWLLYFDCDSSVCVCACMQVYMLKHTFVKRSAQLCMRFTGVVI